MNKTFQHDRARLIRLCLLVITVAVLAAAAGWASGVVLRHPQTSGARPVYAFATAEQGQVGASINVNASAAWSLRPSGMNRATGILTKKYIKSDSKLFAGKVLYSVNLRKTVIAEGEIPAFRSLRFGDKGADVRQLQRLLDGLGHLQRHSNGVVDRPTVRGIERWQTSLAEEPDGVVRQGDILFVPRFPSAGAIIDPKFEVGSSLQGGEKILNILPASPTFSAKVSEEQAALVAENSSVSISGPNGQTWYALASTQHTVPAGVLIDLRPTRPGEVICKTKCRTLSLSRVSLLSAQVVTTRKTTGTVIPSAAVTVDVNNKTIVYDVSGRPLVIQVLASANGESVIQGIGPGARIRVPGDAQ